MKKTILLLHLFLSTIFFAQTNVSGVISSDTSWGLANSPYNITGNILIHRIITVMVMS